MFVPISRPIYNTVPFKKYQKWIIPYIGVRKCATYYPFYDLENKSFIMFNQVYCGNILVLSADRYSQPTRSLAQLKGPKELYKVSHDCPLCGSFQLQSLQSSKGSSSYLIATNLVVLLWKMAEISGKFQLANGDEDNFDKIMAAAGKVFSNSF